jgi:hypothetical protein
MFVEAHPLVFEAKPLHHVRRAAAGARTDLSSGVHDTVPGDGNLVMERTQGIAHEAGMARHARQACDLPVGRHASLGDARYDCVNPSVCGCRCRHDGAPGAFSFPLVTLGRVAAANIQLQNGYARQLKIENPLFSHLHGKHKHLTSAPVVSASVGAVPLFDHARQ